MKYSEAKKIVVQLHARGWFKWPGFREYRKYWQTDEIRYGQAMTIRHIFDNHQHIAKILEHAEEKAEREIREHLRKRGMSYE